MDIKKLVVGQKVRIICNWSYAVNTKGHVTRESGSTTYWGVVTALWAGGGGEVQEIQEDQEAPPVGSKVSSWWNFDPNSFHVPQGSRLFRFGKDGGCHAVYASAEELGGCDSFHIVGDGG